MNATTEQGSASSLDRRNPDTLNGPDIIVAGVILALIIINVCLATRVWRLHQKIINNRKANKRHRTHIL